MKQEFQLGDSNDCFIFVIDNHLTRNAMTQDERDFFNDVKDAVSDYDCSFKHYHEQSSDGDYFCVDVDVDEDDYWDNVDDIWDALSDVASDWDGGIDHDGCHFELAVQLD